ncbi:four-helix bundle copper-binding protein [Thalassoroseus pseudoceratinae]|uniref:four-helix bundle copper-binding protein n=1 Tax=Thalassoroseus pseudoceratinae TaxID=2713176 RepID=UPI00141E68D5|nr:four-helix bundle copper-binding protein [Thalassoroseus pseudoceratinae]
MKNISAEMQQCIDNCNECHQTCLAMLSRHCLEEGGAHVEAEHVRLMLDCIEICRTCADFMTRGSQMHAQVCQVCSDICKACADNCETVGGMDECVAACRKCSESCGSLGG